MQRKQQGTRQECMQGKWQGTKSERLKEKQE